MTDDQMIAELNEALGIEANASHTQRLWTISLLRVAASDAVEQDAKLLKVVQERDHAEHRLTRLMTAHTLFAGHLVDYTKALGEVIDTFHEELSSRVDFIDIQDAFDLALANLRAKKDTGERFDLAEVEQEEVDADETGLNEDVDPLELVDTEPKPEVRVDFPDANEERIGAETTTDFVDARNRVPYYAGEVPLDGETREWLKIMADGGARDGD